MEMTIKNGFHEIQDEELMSVDGGFVVELVETIGETIYQWGYNFGQDIHYWMNK